MIELRNASVQVAGRTLLEAIDLQLEPGELVVLLGPNGAGKSTLLHCLAGDQTLTRGEALLDHRPLRDWPNLSLARRRAVLSQQLARPLGLTAAEVVGLGRHPWGDTPNRLQLHAAMAMAGCEQFHERPIGQLSGGECQRVHLARVLLQLWQAVQGQPSTESRVVGDGSIGDLESRSPTQSPPTQEPKPAHFLLLDEPTSALDWHHQHRLMRLLVDLTRRGLGVLCVLHDPNLAALYADQVILLEDGRNVGMGSPREWLTPEILQKLYQLPLTTLQDQTGRQLLVPA